MLQTTSKPELQTLYNSSTSLDLPVNAEAIATNPSANAQFLVNKLFSGSFKSADAFQAQLQEQSALQKIGSGIVGFASVTRTLLSSVAGSGLTSIVTQNLNTSDHSVIRGLKSIARKTGEVLGVNYSGLLQDQIAKLTNGYSQQLDERDTNTLMNSAIRAFAKKSGPLGLLTGEQSAYALLLVQTGVAKNSDEAANILMNAGNSVNGEASQREAKNLLLKAFNSISSRVNSIIKFTHSTAAEEQERAAKLIEAIKSDGRVLGSVGQLATDAVIGTFFPIVSSSILAFRLSKAVFQVKRGVKGEDVLANEAVVSKLVMEKLMKQDDYQNILLDTARSLFSNPDLLELTQHQTSQATSFISNLISQKVKTQGHDLTTNTILDDINPVKARNSTIFGKINSAIASYARRQINLGIDSGSLVDAISSSNLKVQLPDGMNSVKNYSAIVFPLEHSVNELLKTVSTPEVKAELRGLKSVATKIGLQALIVSGVNALGDIIGFSIAQNVAGIKAGYGNYEGFAENVAKRFGPDFDASKFSQMNVVEQLFAFSSNRHEAVLNSPESLINICQKFKFEDAIALLSQVKEFALNPLGTSASAAPVNLPEGYKLPINSENDLPTTNAPSVSVPTISKSEIDAALTDLSKISIRGEGSNKAFIVRVKDSTGAIRNIAFSANLYKLSDLTPGLVAKVISSEGFQKAGKATIVDTSVASIVSDFAQRQVETVKQTAGEVRTKVVQLTEKVTAGTQSIIDSVTKKGIAKGAPIYSSSGSVGVNVTYKFNIEDKGTTGITIIGRGGKTLEVNSKEITDYFKKGGKPENLINQQFFSKVLDEALKSSKMNLNDINPQLGMFKSADNFKPFTGNTAIADAMTIIRDSGILKLAKDNESTFRFTTSKTSVVQGQGMVISDLIQKLYRSTGNNISQQYLPEDFNKAANVIRALETLRAAGITSSTGFASNPDNLNVAQRAILDQNIKPDELSSLNALSRAYGKAFATPLSETGLNPQNLSLAQAAVNIDQIQAAKKSRELTLSKFAKEVLRFDTKQNSNLRISQAERSLITKFANSDGSTEFTGKEVKDFTKLFSQLTRGGLTYEVGSDELAKIGTSLLAEESKRNQLILQSSYQTLIDAGFTRLDNGNWIAKGPKGEEIEITSPTYTVGIKESQTIGFLKTTIKIKTIDGEETISRNANVDIVGLVGFVAKVASGTIPTAVSGERDANYSFRDAGYSEQAINALVSEAKSVAESRGSTETGTGMYNIANRLTQFMQLRSMIPNSVPGASALKDFPMFAYGKKEGGFTVFSGGQRIPTSLWDQLQNSNIEGLNKMQAEMLGAFKAMKETPGVGQVFDFKQRPMVVVNGVTYANMSPYEAITKAVKVSVLEGRTTHTITMSIDGGKAVEITDAQFTKIQELGAKLSSNPSLAKAVLISEGLEDADQAGTINERMHRLRVELSELAPVGIIVDSQELSEMMDIIPKDAQQAAALESTKSWIKEQEDDLFPAYNTANYRKNSDSFVDVLRARGISNGADLAKSAEEMLKGNGGDYKLVENPDGTFALMYYKPTGERNVFCTQYGRRIIDKGVLQKDFGFYRNDSAGIVTVMISKEDAQAFKWSNPKATSFDSIAALANKAGSRMYLFMKGCQGNGGEIIPGDVAHEIVVERKIGIEAATSNNGQLTTNIGSTVLATPAQTRLVGGVELTVDAAARQLSILESLSNSNATPTDSMVLAASAFATFNSDPANFDTDKYFSEMSKKFPNMDLKSSKDLFTVFKSNPLALFPHANTALAGLADEEKSKFSFSLEITPPKPRIESVTNLPGTDWRPSLDASGKIIPDAWERTLPGKATEFTRNLGGFNITLVAKDSSSTSAVGLHTIVQQGPDGKAIKTVTTGVANSSEGSVAGFGGGRQFEDSGREVEQKIEKKTEQVGEQGGKIGESAPTDQPNGVAGAPKGSATAEGSGKFGSSNPNATGAGPNGETPTPGQPNAGNGALPNTSPSSTGTGPSNAAQPQGQGNSAIGGDLTNTGPTSTGSSIGGNGSNPSRPGGAGTTSTLGGGSNSSTLNTGAGNSTSNLGNNAGGAGQGSDALNTGSTTTTGGGLNQGSGTNTLSNGAGSTGAGALNQGAGGAGQGAPTVAPLIQAPPVAPVQVEVPPTAVITPVEIAPIEAPVIAPAEAITESGSSISDVQPIQ